MFAIFMMDSMHLRPLEDIADPVRSLNISVIEELADGGKKRVNGGGFWRETKKAIHQQATQDRVDRHFDGMLVKRSEHFDATRTVMNLVKDQPEPLDMADAMPPIKDERADEPIE